MQTICRVAVFPLQTNERLFEHGGGQVKFTKVEIRSVPTGVPLGMDLYRADGNVIFPRGTVLTEYEIVLARIEGNEQVYIVEETSDEAERLSHAKLQTMLTAPQPPKPEPAPQKPTASGKIDWATIDFDDAYRQFIARMNDFYVRTKNGQRLERYQIEDTVEAMLVVLLRSDVSPLKRLGQLKEGVDYLIAHPINVTIVSALLGKWMKLPIWMNKDVATAALLHDIGKATIDPAILNKPDRLTEEEFETMKRHPRFSANITAMMFSDKPAVTEAVLQHHERMDGSGYPGRVADGPTTLIGRIVAVADVYDAITSRRVYAEKESPFTAAEILLQDSFGKLDPKVVQVLYDQLTKFSIGSRVQLSDGRTGQVIYIHPTMPTRPVIDIEGSHYDLARQKDVRISEILE